MNNKKPEYMFVYGSNVYYTKKGDSIYYYPLLKKAVYIDARDASKFQTYKFRFTIEIVLLFMLIYFWAVRGYFNVYPFLIVGGLAIFLELGFLLYIKSCKPVEKFYPERLISQYDVNPKGYVDRHKGKALVGFGLAVMLLYYAIKCSFPLDAFAIFGLIAAVSALYGYIALKEVLKHK